MVGMLGLEPRLGTNQVLLVYKTSGASLHYMPESGGPTRFRPVVNRLKADCSTIELQARNSFIRYGCEPLHFIFELRDYFLSELVITKWWA